MINLPEEQRLLHVIFLNAVQQWPQNKAIECEGVSWSYQELYKRVCQYAIHIDSMLDKNAVPGCIALYGNKSLESVAAILAVLMCGYCYMPLDVTWPAQRIEATLAMAKPALLLLTQVNPYLETQLKQVQQLPVTIRLAELKSEVFIEPAALLATSLQISSEQISYLLFTSGSTGIPKGVCVSHRAAVSAIDMLYEHVTFTATDKIANQAALCYDLSMFDLFSGFRVGASVHLIPPHILKIPKQYIAYLVEHQLTSVFMVCSAIEFMLKYTEENSYQLYFKNLLLTGDPISENLLGLLRKKLLPSCKVWDLYSAVEMPYAFAQLIEFQRENLNLRAFEEFGSKIKYHFRDANKEVVAGEGQLCVESPVLFSGYITPQQDLATIQNNPLTIYYTGDYVKAYGAGIELYGRIDRQIKVMGNRIELDDIEANLESLAPVQEAVVFFNEASQKIIAFVVIRASHANDNNIIKVLKELCSKKIPAVMNPHEFVLIADMPRTTSGKRDRKQLVKQYHENSSTLAAFAT
jgi:D-alanine--poly(phosphoribitol) ligase subunit 1